MPTEAQKKGQSPQETAEQKLKERLKKASNQLEELFGDNALNKKSSLLYEALKEKFNEKKFLQDKEKFVEDLEKLVKFIDKLKNKKLDLNAVNNQFKEVLVNGNLTFDSYMKLYSEWIKFKDVWERYNEIKEVLKLKELASTTPEIITQFEQSLRELKNITGKNNVNDMHDYIINIYTTMRSLSDMFYKLDPNLFSFLLSQTPEKTQQNRANLRLAYFKFILNLDNNEKYRIFKDEDDPNKIVNLNEVLLDDIGPSEVKYKKFINENLNEVSLDDIGRSEEKTFINENKEKIKTAREIWGGYYQDLLRQISFDPNKPNMLSEREIIALTNMQQIDGLLALKFFDLYKVLREKSLLTVESIKLLLIGAYKLNYISPSLVMKYFSALEKIADICGEGENDVFLKALFKINVWIDKKTADVYNTPLLRSDFEFLVTAAQTISDLNEFFNVIIGFEKDDYTKENAANLVNENLYRDPNTGNFYQRRFAERFSLLNPQQPPSIPSLLGPSPFYNVNAGIPSTLSLLLPSVRASTQLGGRGSVVIPQQPGGFLISSGVSQVFDNALNLLYPAFPTVEVKGLGLPSLRLTNLFDLLRAIDNAAMLSAPELILKEGPTTGGFSLAAGGKEKSEGGAASFNLVDPPSIGSLEAGGAYVEEAGKTVAVTGVNARAIYLGDVTIQSGAAGFEINTNIPEPVRKAVLDLIASRRLREQGGVLLSYSEITRTEITEEEQSKGSTETGTEGTGARTEKQQQKRDRTIRTGKFYLVIPDQKNPNKAHVLEVEGLQNDYFTALSTLAALSTTKGFIGGGAIQPHGETGSVVIGVDIENVSLFAHGAKLNTNYLSSGAAKDKWLQFTGGLSIPVGIRKYGSEEHIKPVYFYEEFKSGVGTDKIKSHEVKVIYTSLKREGWSFELTGVGGVRNLSPGGNVPVLGLSIRGERPSERPSKIFSKAGFSLYYEGASTDAMRVASILNDQESYIRSMRRVAAQLYGGEVELPNFLASSIMELLYQTYEDYQNATGKKKEEMFFRFAGLIRSLKKEGILSFDVSRAPQLNTLISDLDSLLSSAGTNPKEAARQLEIIKEKYRDTIMKGTWNYAFTITLRPNLGIELGIVTREDVEGTQHLEKGSARILFKFKLWEKKEGFLSLEGSFSEPLNSIISDSRLRKGMERLDGFTQLRFGLDLLNAEWFSRAAAGYALLFGKEEGKGAEVIGSVGTFLVDIYDQAKKDSGTLTLIGSYSIYSLRNVSSVLHELGLIGQASILGVTTRWYVQGIISNELERITIGAAARPGGRYSRFEGELFARYGVRREEQGGKVFGTSISYYFTPHFKFSLGGYYANTSSLYGPLGIYYVYPYEPTKNWGLFLYLLFNF